MITKERLLAAIAILVLISIALIINEAIQTHREREAAAKKQRERDMVLREERLHRERIQHQRDQLWRECENWRKGIK